LRKNKPWVSSEHASLHYLPPPFVWETWLISYRVWYPINAVLSQVFSRFQAHGSASLFSNFFVVEMQQIVTGPLIDNFLLTSSRVASDSIVTCFGLYPIKHSAFIIACMTVGGTMSLRDFNCCFPHHAIPPFLSCILWRPFHSSESLFLK